MLAALLLLVASHAPPVFTIDGSQYTQVPFIKRDGTLDHLDVEIAPNGDRGVVCTELPTGLSCLVVDTSGHLHEMGHTTFPNSPGEATP